MSQYFMLTDRKNVVPCSLEGWSRSIEDFQSRMVAKELWRAKDLTLEVSTVFLGLDHGFGEDPALGPVVFETMIFGIEDEFQLRCRTYDEALKMHRNAVDWLKIAYPDAQLEKKFRSLSEPQAEEWLLT